MAMPKILVYTYVHALLYSCYFFGIQFCFYTSWYTDSSCYLYMNKNTENYIGKEHAFVIMNHKYEVDWCIIANILNHFPCLGNYKSYIKHNVQYYPIVGWTYIFAEQVFVHRSFDKNRKTINTQVQELVNYPDPMWLILYAEGTRFTPDKHKNSLQYARENSFPQLRHHLIPRSKGFVTSLAAMKGKMGAIYNLTLAFDPKAEVKPTIFNILRGRKIDAHFYIKRIPFETVPEDKQAAKQFLYDLFQEKDKLLESFFNTGNYCSESGTEKAEKIKIRPCFKMAMITGMWYTLIMAPLIYYIVQLSLSANMYSLSIILGVISLVCLLFSIILRESVKKSSYGISAK